MEQNSTKSTTNPDGPKSSAFVLKLAADNLLISGTAVGANSIQLEANAAMKSIVHKDPGEHWTEYLLRLVLEEGLIYEDAKPADE